MKKKRLVLVLALAAVICLAGTTVYCVCKQEPHEWYQTQEEALRAGLTRESMSNPDTNAPIFSYEKNESSFYIIPYTINDDGALTYAEAIYALRIVHKEKGYFFQQSQCYAVLQEDEAGNVSYGHTFAQFWYPEEKVALIVGKSGNNFVSPSVDNLVATNLKDGIADNSWGIFVLVYENMPEPPIPEISLDKMLIEDTTS